MFAGTAEPGPDHGFDITTLADRIAVGGWPALVVEADAIVQLRDGRWAAFEVRLGQHQVDEAAKNLISVAERVDPSVHGRPAALGVITGWGTAHRRGDGVWVIPIGSLAE